MGLSWFDSEGSTREGTEEGGLCRGYSGNLHMWGGAVGGQQNRKGVVVEGSFLAGGLENWRRLQRLPQI